MERYEQCRQTVEEGLRQKIDLSREVSDEEVREMIDEMVIHCSRQYALSLKDRQQLGREIFDAIRRMDILQELVEEEEVTEIMINGTQGIFIERKGRLFQWDKNFASKEKLEDVIQQIVAKCNRAVNEASPIVDARLENGARVNIVLAPVALNGPIVTIRRFPSHPIGMTDLLAYGSLTNEAARDLEKWVKAGYNIIISGGTGSGKTTFLNALSQYIPSTDRVITIEDSAELQIQGIPNLVRLETRDSKGEGTTAITIRDLIRSSLRMRPDRIIVGEVRGSEAIDMLQALNTGHDGSLSTGHANSATDMLMRLETMVLMGMELPLNAVRRQIASGVDIIVQLGRLRDKSRKVLEIVEITGYEDGEILTRPLYQFLETGTDEEGHVMGQLQMSNTLMHTDKLLAAGL
ncbi:MAG TPA: pilus assembly protein [Lachnospiraceae bacterium]|mgnify:CR=1 FL=1|nr:pilus assembly protein [Lachnospiraceae bacterium]